MGLPPIPTPLIIFVDERVERRSGGTRMIASCCAFRRDGWTTPPEGQPSIGAVRRRRRLAAVEALLGARQGFAMLVYADIPAELLARGEIDGTTDIPRMSRTDNLWSQLVLSGVAATIAFVHDTHASIGRVDLYFDRKDLTAAHRTGFETVLRETLPEIQRQAAVEFPALFGAGPSQLHFGAITGVAKRASRSAMDTFQSGTDLAHHLCSQAAQVIKRGPLGRIWVRDHTHVVRSMIGNFIVAANDSNSPVNGRGHR